MPGSRSPSDAAIDTAAPDRVLAMREPGVLRVLPWITLLVCLSLTALAWHVSSNRVWHIKHEQFHTRVQELQLHLRERISVYEQILRGVSGLLQSNPNLSRSAFADYIRALRLPEQFPGLDGVGYAVSIPANSLDYYEQHVQQEGFPSFHIFPQYARDVYTSVHYIEPFSGGNRLAFGFDMYTDPVRRQAMDMSSTTGQLAMSARADLIRTADRTSHSGFLMYLPIYKIGVTPATAQQRKANLQGWAYAPLWVDDLMNGIVRGLPAGLMIELYDGATPTSENRIYSTETSEHHDQALPGLSTRVALDLAQHTWTLYVGALPALYAEHSDRTPLVIGLTGAALSLTLTGLMWLLVYGRQRTLRSARRMNHDLLQAQQDLLLASKVFSHAREGIMITDPHGIILRVNATLCEMTGYSAQELVGNNPRMLNSGRQDSQFYEKLWQSVATQGYWQGQTWNRRKTGELYAQLLAISSVRNDQGEITHYVGLSTDITSIKQQEKRLEQLASTDALTGLPNRLLLADRMEQAMLRVPRSGDLLAVAFIDLDGFKAINDQYGHDIGDQLLISVAARMKSALRNSDTLARLGGDEFIAVLEISSEGGVLEGLLGRLLLAASEPVIIDTVKGACPLSVSASIGVALLNPGDDADADRLIRHADVAMYAAKQKGKNCYVIFDRHQFSH